MSARYFTNSIVRRDQESYAKKLKMPTGSMAELKRAYLDVNFFNLPEIRALMRKFKKLAGLALVQIYLAMSAAEGGKIDEDALCAILEENEIRSPEAFIAYCLDKSLIKLFREIISDSSEINPDSPGSKSRLPVYDYDNDIEINLKELDTPQIRAAIQLFAKTLSANGRELTQTNFDAWAMPYAGRPDDFLSDLLYSAGLTKTKGFYPRPTTGPRAGGKEKESSKDTLTRLMAEAIAEEQANAEN